MIVLFGAGDDADGVGIRSPVVASAETREQGGCDRRLARHFGGGRGEVAVGVVTAPGACERWGQETRIKRFVVRGVSLERGLCACTV